MYRVIKPRGGGKTTEILHLAEETGATVLCANPRLMQQKIKTEGFNTNVRCISYNDIMFEHNHVYLIDEIDGFLRALAPNIIGYSLSPED